MNAPQPNAAFIQATRPGFGPLPKEKSLQTRFDLSATPWRLIVLNYRLDICCLVDAIDYAWLVKHTWNEWWSGRARWQLYAKRNTGPDRDTVRMHREILKIADPRLAIELLDLHGDHFNGQTLDNRRANLRWLTPVENRRNTHAREKIPSLERIIGRLLAGLPADGAGDIPF
jgi:hypothetical protein